jgi:hypothetical protein
MTVQRWAWLIGMTDAGDGQLLDWARSYAAPPSVAVRGGRLDSPAYAPERRAIRLIVEGDEVVIRLQPSPCCVNPVFELDGDGPSPQRRQPRRLRSVTLGGRVLASDEYAWDGRVLWLSGRIAGPTDIAVALAP